jgi:hypothetical protein
VTGRQHTRFVAVLLTVTATVSLFANGVATTGAYMTDSGSGSIGGSIGAVSNGAAVVAVPTPSPTPTTACVQDATSVVSHALAIHGSVATGSLTVADCTGLVVSLVSYQAPSATFSEATASPEVVFDSTTLTLDGGAQQLHVNVPGCYFDVDLVVGSVITQLGPAGSGNFYGAQGRLLDTITGGTRACGGKTHP